MALQEDQQTSGIWGEGTRMFAPCWSLNEAFNSSAALILSVSYAKRSPDINKSAIMQEGERGREGGREDSIEMIRYDNTAPV